MRIRFRISTARRKHISDDESGGATAADAVSAGPVDAPARTVASKDKSGVTADETATFVPNLSASRRVILLLICFLTTVSRGNDIIGGLPNEQKLFGDYNGVLKNWAARVPDSKQLAFVSYQLGPAARAGVAGGAAGPAVTGGDRLRRKAGATGGAADGG